jgi:hypothetical protein
VGLLATTSFDGSIATTFKRTITDVVCDDTREMALAEQGQTYKVKHSRHSHAQLAPAREALAMVHTIADDFASEVAQLCAIDVTDAQWNQFLDQQVPLQSGRTGAPGKGGCVRSEQTSGPGVAAAHGSRSGFGQRAMTRSSQCRR